MLILIGSKEGIAHIPWAYLEEGDVALVPSPGYPVYKVMTLLAGGTPYFMPLREENEFRPVFDDIPEDVKKRQSSASLTIRTTRRARTQTTRFTKRQSSSPRDTISSSAMTRLTASHLRRLHGKEHPAVRQGKRYSIEFLSLSKTYCMTGWRVAFAVGNADAIQNLGKLKTNIDSGVFLAIRRPR